MRRILLISFLVQVITLLWAVAGFGLLSEAVASSLVGLGLLLHGLRSIKPAEEPVLQILDLQRLIEKKVTQKTEELRDLVKKYEREALTDPLTGLLNRRGGETYILKSVARSKRMKNAISFLAIDLDYFKKINDAYGHMVGDQVLCITGSAIVAHLRASDFAARWGGEEFLVCLPDTDREGACLVAEKLRQAVAETVFENGLQVTASIGVAELLKDEDIYATLARADLNLYIAKGRGRNCVFPSNTENSP